MWSNNTEDGLKKCLRKHKEQRQINKLGHDESEAVGSGIGLIQDSGDVSTHPSLLPLESMS